MSKQYIPSKYPVVCEYVYPSRYNPIENVMREQSGDNWLMSYVINFELLDSNKELIEAMSVRMTKEFDHEPLLQEQCDFITADYQNKMAELKKQYADYPPEE